VGVHIKNNLKQLGFILLIVLLGTIIDYAVHSSSQRFFVLLEYYPNKIIFGTFWGFVSFKILRRWIKTPMALAVSMCAFVSIVLQTKYFLQGYAVDFVILFMFLHFGMFILPAVPIFRKFWPVFEPKTANPKGEGGADTVV